MYRSILILFPLLLAVPGCKTETKQPPASVAELATFLTTYSGAWRGAGMELTITKAGMVSYSRKGASTLNKSFTAPLLGVTPQSFTAGLPGLATTFRIDRPPHDQGGVRRMTLDGIELTNQASAGGPAAGSVVCTRLDGDRCADPTSQFPPSVEEIQLSSLVERAPGVGPRFVIAWIAEDVGQAAPANHVIATTPLALQDDPNKLAAFTIKGQLSRPTKGWPTGKYRVEVRSGDKVVQTARFQIVAPPAP